jgi:putative transposase
VSRDFTAPAPNRVWTADTTYVPAGEGWLYLAVVLGAQAKATCFAYIEGFY